MVAKESTGGKGPAKEFFYKENVPEEIPEHQPGDAETKAVD
jgi:hypothetical protein